MNFCRDRIVLCMLIIIMGIDFTASWPVFNTKNDSSRFETSALSKSRFSRQVVQPKWLNFGQEPAIDPTVFVNQKALMEAKEIRKSIQKAVKEDTFAENVQNERQNPNNPTEAPRPVEFNPTPPMHRVPDWYVQIQNLWRNWTQILFRGFRN